MKILGVRLHGFRNLEPLDVTFSAGVNVLLGANGQGKTNLLEALNFFALGRSHRGAQNEELIRFDQDHLHVALTVEDDNGVHRRYEYGIDRGGDRRFRMDGDVVTRRADLVGQLATVFFWPESVSLVRGGPERRRRFADQGLSGLDSEYLTALTAYQRALKQKARLLRDLRRGFRRDTDAHDELTAWNRDLAEHAVVIGLGRHRWAADLAPYATASYQALVCDARALDISYQPQLSALAEAPKTNADAELKEEILAEFDYIVPEEIRRGRPLIGLQFDDFRLRLGDLDLRVYGSQGETRSAAIALILAQSDVVYERRRVRPVLFLDDIFSELDRERARRLQQWCASHHQVFIATARDDDVAGWIPEHRRSWHVEAGRLTTHS